MTKWYLSLLNSTCPFRNKPDWLVVGYDSGFGCHHNTSKSTLTVGGSVRAAVVEFHQKDSKNSATCCIFFLPLKQRTHWQKPIGPIIVNGVHQGLSFNGSSFHFSVSTTVTPRRQCRQPDLDFTLKC